jgi:hypothetical protein
MLRAAILFVTLPLIPALAHAQEPTAVRAVRAAVVLEQPDASAPVVASINTGEVLEVLDSRQGWFLVKPPEGSDRAWRTGWVASESVRALAASIAPDLREQTRQQSATLVREAAARGDLTEAEDRAVRRKALTMGIIGVGTFVAGLIVHQSGDDGLDLPGASTTQETVGFSLMGLGGYWAGTGLWRAFR